MPAVNYDLMLQEMLRKTPTKQNEVVYWSRPVDWKNQTLTPNPDALYFMIFFNTKDVGPIVIDVPPADGGSFAANIDTVWQMPLEDAGPYGADKGAGGKYLILPPSYMETAPKGYIPVQSETFVGYALFRSNLPSHGDVDIAKAAAYGKRLKVYPLSQATNPDAGFPPFFPGARWAVPAFPALVKAGSSGYAETDIYPVDARALTYSIGYIGIKRLGAAQTYLIASKDSDGPALDGDKTYRLHVPPNVPVEQYWSVTAYDRETHALIKNMPRASRASNAAEVQKNDDGSVDIYFSPKAPAGSDSNWVPTDPQRGFELPFRLYAPTKALFDKAWTLPDVEKMAGQ